MTCTRPSAVNADTRHAVDEGVALQRTRRVLGKTAAVLALIGRNEAGEVGDDGIGGATFASTSLRTEMVLKLKSRVSLRSALFQANTTSTHENEMPKAAATK